MTAGETALKPHMKTTIIHHSADFDGQFCGRIAKKFLPEAEVIGWDFGDPPVGLDVFNDNGLVYVLDLPVDRVFGFNLATSEPTNFLSRALQSRVIWIDHHGSSIACHPSEIAGYRIDGVAACRLAWQWFMMHQDWDPREQQPPYSLPDKSDYISREVKEPLSVRLAGEYDIWDKRDERAEVFQFGLRSQELGESMWELLLSGPNPDEGDKRGAAEITVDALLENGAMLQRYQQRNDAGVVNFRSFLMEFEGLKFLTLNTARCNSLTFAAKDVPETGHDAICGFYWTGKAWKVSLYHARHRMDLDLSKIAVKYGGGGHKGACGFERQTLPWIPGVEQLKDAGEYLWVVLANVSGGDWAKQTPEWQEAAAKSRNQFHAVCKQLGLTVA